MSSSSRRQEPRHDPPHSDPPPFDWRQTLMLTAAFAAAVILLQIFT